MTKFMRRKTIGYAAAIVAAALMVPAAASADTWNERTIMKFDEPVLVPGATLQPGTYVFKLVNPDTSQHLVQITTEDGSKVIATTHAVPVKRQQSTGDIVVKFNPTAAGVPPAIKGWFYPGSLYGQQFVYPDQQARDIANRTKTVVLSMDAQGTDRQKGVLHTYDESGVRGQWSNDPAVNREWQEWQRQSASAKTYTDNRPGTEPDASATAIDAAGTAQRVSLGEIEEAPRSFVGKTVSVDAEVQDVFGPRLFSIDEPNWGDLDGEILVHMPSALAALVREGDRVTVTGQIKPYVRAEFEQEWGWFDEDRTLDAELSKKPVLVATQLLGGDSNSSMVINARPGQSARQDDASTSTMGNSRSPAMTGTSGSTLPDSVNKPKDKMPKMGQGAMRRDGRVNDISLLNQRGEDLVGHQVELTNMNVAGTAKDGGFFVRGPQGAQVLVVPSNNRQNISISQGSNVTVKGVVLEMPRGKRDTLKAPGDVNDEVYVLATDVTRQSGVNNR